MKRIHRITKWITPIIGAALITGLVIGINIEKEYDPVIGGFLANEANKANTDSGGEVGEKNNGGKLCTELLEEGIVLLKNENHALPLSHNKKVNIFGYGATENGWLQIGVGSGSTKPNANKSVNLLQAFENEEYEYNEDLIEAYNSFSWPARVKGSSSDTKKASVYYQYEASRNWYESNGWLDNAKAYSDTAIFVISRVSGENTRTDSNSKESVPAEQTLITDGGAKQTVNNRTYLQTTSVEEGVIDMLSENFSKVIVLLNTTNAMFLESMDDRVDALLYVGVTGECGAEAIPEILYGEVNPSGHLSDTFPIVPKADPVYANRNDYNSPVFEESIYFGYKWYETADKMNFWSSSFASTNFGIHSYEEAVFRPFGYGESYTSFTQQITSIKKNGVDISTGDNISNNDEITVEVNITNTGTIKGKDVTQLYVELPFTTGGIEKPSIALLDFGKSEDIEPGASKNVSMSFHPYDMASFDAYDKNNNNHKGYELENGTYHISIRKDVHTLIEDFTLNVSNTIFFDNDPVTNTSVVPLFTGTNAYKNAPIDGSSFISDSEYLSRSNFASTFPLNKNSGTIVNNSSMASEAADSIATEYYNYTEAPNFGVENNLRILLKEDDTFPTASDLNGESGAKLKLNVSLVDTLANDYDDPTWDLLLDQMSLDEMVNMIYFSGFKTKDVVSVGKPLTREIDGPAGYNGTFSPVTVDPSWTSFPDEAIIGCTFSKRLLNNLGLCIGAEGQGETGVNALYGPGINLHRSPFGSRNFEYFSEDRVLSGKLAAEEIEGAKNNGVYMYMKHFICDEQGYNPRNTITWVDEQVLREEYARPFEIAVKEGGANAVMTSFNKLGNIYTGHNYALCTTMLREEWGFKGTVITDYYTGADASMNARKCAYAGNDAILNPLNSYASGRRLDLSNVNDMHVARKSAKNILYTYVSTYSYAINHDAKNPIYEVKLNISGQKAMSTNIAHGLTIFTIIVGIIFSFATLFGFVRPVVKVDGKLYMTAREEKVRKEIRTYSPFVLAFISLLISLLARSSISKSFFTNFFTGVFADIGAAFTNFGFSVLMNVVVYIGILAFIGANIFFILKYRKRHDYRVILAHISTLIGIFMVMSSLGVLLFALSTDVLLKSLSDILLVALVNVISLTTLGICIYSDFKL